MTISVSAETIEDIQKAMAENQRMIAMLQSGRFMPRPLAYALQAALRYTIDITHVDSGALKNAHRGAVVSITRAEISIDPSAVGPNGRPFVYGEYEHYRGGSHAFYDRTIVEAGPEILNQAERMAAGELGL